VTPAQQFATEFEPRLIEPLFRHMTAGIFAMVRALRGMASPTASGELAMYRERVMSSYVKYCKAQAAECARRAKLASSPELAAERRSLGLRWLKLAEKAKAMPLGRPREAESAAQGLRP